MAERTMWVNWDKFRLPREPFSYSWKALVAAMPSMDRGTYKKASAPDPHQQIRLVMTSLHPFRIKLTNLFNGASSTWLI